MVHGAEELHNAEQQECEQVCDNETRSKLEGTKRALYQLCAKVVTSVGYAGSGPFLTECPNVFISGE